jgi:16S rRNA (adenine1518-N6/adenine1519-N6)-dimethyltransferase
MNSPPKNPHPKTLLKGLEQQARKRFGQNFLISESVLKKIVSLARVNAETKVVEIGPGLGALSRHLLATKATVHAVELDRDLAAFLKEDLPDLEMHQGDALKMDWAEVCPGEGWTVCANLPYNVATPIVLKLLGQHPRFDRLVLMFQDEVAKRLVAEPGSRAYGSLSVFAQAHSRVSYGFRIPPGAFYPAPKVHSAVVRFDLYDAPLTGGCDPKFFERVVRAGFMQRRKRLSNAIGSQFGKALAVPALDATVGAGRRAEELDLEEWGRLAGALADAISAESVE